MSKSSDQSAPDGMIHESRDALLNLSVSPQQRGLAFGFHRAMDNFGAVIGPLIAAGLLALGLSLRSVILCAFVPAILVTCAIIVLLVVMLLFGAARLPKLARSLGESAREFRGGMSAATDRVDDSVDLAREAVDQP